MNLFISRLIENPYFYGIWVVLLVFSICVHEFFHAAAALREGDDTAAVNGHLTLNPLKQMGPFSLVMLAFMGIAWGQVPVNPRMMRNRWSPARVAFAGPFANLLLFFFFAITAAAIATFAPEAEWRGTLYSAMRIGAFLNLLLFAFNMIPAYPLDGWTILYTIHPFPRVKPEVLNVISVVVFLLAFSFFGYFIAYFSIAADFLIGQVADLFAMLIKSGA